MSESNRQHLRLPLQSTVFIELVSAQAGRDDAEIAVCKTLDVSPAGLRVSVQQELTEQAYLQIGVDTLDEAGEQSNTIYLAAQVRWCRPGETPERPWDAGLELLNAQGSDIQRWVKLISQIEE